MDEERLIERVVVSSQHQLSRLVRQTFMLRSNSTHRRHLTLKWRLMSHFNCQPGTKGLRHRDHYTSWHRRGLGGDKWVTSPV